MLKIFSFEFSSLPLDVSTTRLRRVASAIPVTSHLPSKFKLDTRTKLWTAWNEMTPLRSCTIYKQQIIDAFSSILRSSWSKVTRKITKLWMRKSVRFGKISKQILFVFCLTNHLVLLIVFIQLILRSSRVSLQPTRSINFTSNSVAGFNNLKVVVNAKRKIGNDTCEWNISWITCRTFRLLCD